MLSLEGDKIECMVRLDFPTTNNEAEYEAVATGLNLAKAASAEHAMTPGNVLSFVQHFPLIDPDNMQEIRSERNWTTQIA